MSERLENSGSWQIARLENRLGDVESDVDSFEEAIETVDQKGDEQHQEVMSLLSSIQSDVRSNGERQTRLDARMSKVESTQEEHDRLIHRWTVPLAILVAIITLASIAGVFGMTVMEVV